MDTNLHKWRIVNSRFLPVAWPSGWRNEVFRGSTKCRAVPSEGSAMPCTTEEAQAERVRICENSCIFVVKNSKILVCSQK